MELPKRKKNRLKNYDYSQPNTYFITVCTEKRKNMFWANVGASIARPEDVRLSEYGKIVEEYIRDIPNHYGAITVDHFVIMPNHIHLLFQIHTNQDGRALLAPTVSTAIAQMKGVITKKIGHSIWQKSFHDHVIRNKKDYELIWNYIEGNPMKWSEDCFYTEEKSTIE